MGFEGLRTDIAAAVGGIATLGGKREIEALHTYLYDGEHVSAAAVGTYANGGGLLVLTSERLLFVLHGHVKRAQEDFPLARIASVEWKSGLMTGEITIKASGANAVIKGVQKKDGQRLVDAARTAVRETTASHVVPAPSSAAGAGADGDPRTVLRELQAWHTEGLITDEEYAAKRAEVLARV